MKKLENILEVRIKDEIFGFDADFIEQILVIPTITKVPLSDKSLLGVVVLGGKVVNVIDLGLAIDVESVDINSDKSRLLTFSNFSESLVVDEVLNMINIDEKNLEENIEDDSFLNWFYKSEDSIVQILNFEKLFKSVTLDVFKPKVVESLESESVENIYIDDKNSLRVLFFKCEDERFGIDIEMLRELIFVPDEIISVAGSDSLGIITLRDRVVPLIDINNILGFKSKKIDFKSRVLVVTYYNKVISFLVDEVEEVKNINSRDLEPFNNEFVSDIFNEESDISSILSNDFIKQLIRKYHIDGDEDIEKESEKKETILSEIAVFKIEGEEYAFDIEEVQEIIIYENITPVPEAPEFVEGILNLRGAVISVVSLAKRLGFQSRINDKTKIIVCLVESEKIGFIVDDVDEILFVEDKYISKSASSEALFDEVINLDNGKRVILKIKSNNLLDKNSLNNIKKMEK